MIKIYISVSVADLIFLRPQKREKTWNEEIREEEYTPDTDKS